MNLHIYIPSLLLKAKIIRRQISQQKHWLTRPKMIYSNSFQKLMLRAKAVRYIKHKHKISCYPSGVYYHASYNPTNANASTKLLSCKRLQPISCSKFSQPTNVVQMRCHFVTIIPSKSSCKISKHCFQYDGFPNGHTAAEPGYDDNET